MREVNQERGVNETRAVQKKYMKQLDADGPLPLSALVISKS